MLDTPVTMQLCNQNATSSTPAAVCSFNCNPGLTPAAAAEAPGEKLLNVLIPPAATLAGDAGGNPNPS
jgi:hypothetical protein